MHPAEKFREIEGLQWCAPDQWCPQRVCRLSTFAAKSGDHLFDVRPLAFPKSGDIVMNFYLPICTVPRGITLALGLWGIMSTKLTSMRCQVARCAPFLSLFYIGPTVTRMSCLRRLLPVFLAGPWPTVCSTAKSSYCALGLATPERSQHG